MGGCCGLVLEVQGLSLYETHLASEMSSHAMTEIVRRSVYVLQVRWANVTTARKRVLEDRPVVKGSKYANCTAVSKWGASLCVIGNWMRDSLAKAEVLETIQQLTQRSTSQSYSSPGKKTGIFSSLA